MIYEKAEEVLKILTNRGQTIAFSESCTGGMLSGVITSNPGASQIFLGSLIAYSNQVKCRVLGVNMSTLEEFGAVSVECALEMVQGTFNVFSSDYAISITGIAGPDGGTASKPVGLVYIGIGDQEFIDAHQFRFYGNRDEIRQQATLKALELILEKLS